MTLQLAQRSDLTTGGLPAAALVGVPTATQDYLLLKNSAKVLTFTRAHYGDIDSSNIPVELTGAVVDLTVLDIFLWRGVSADDPAVQLYAMRAKDTKDWLTLLARGEVALVTPDATLEDEGAPQVGYPDQSVVDDPHDDSCANLDPLHGRRW